jgi:sigma-B regulation protein RsbU (phosphoserine phosphatase)
VDIPVDEQAIAQLREATGIDLQSVSVVSSGETPPVVQGRSREPSAAVVTKHESEGGTYRWTFNSAAIFDCVDWSTGGRGTLLMGIRVSVREIYDRIVAAQSRVKNVSLGELFMFVLGAIAVLFLIIEAVAFVMGLALARSITGSIHQLFVGTQRVQLGDFSHRIRIRTRDQLGELADSFNEMTGSIEALLRQAEEKKRLEEELRIARQIQMSLLPRGPLSLPGLAVTALCVPAREVGGDYYDFFPLGDQRLGVLIADVAGKGTSAALYMAELKGIVLSLSKICQSPKQLLIEVNRIISTNLDSRSFITMTYAVVDLGARTLTYARAGHTPLIYMPGRPRPGQSQVLAPDGLVLGLRIEGVASKFEQLLEEATLPMQSDDVFVFYTDGITEAMNPAADLFGEQRLQQLVEEHADLPSEQLRERILREVEAFVSGADQHDDMTMILLKVEGSASQVPA